MFLLRCKICLYVKSNNLFYSYISCHFICFSNLIMYGLSHPCRRYKLSCNYIHKYLPSFGVMFIKSFSSLRLCKYSTIRFLPEVLLIQFSFSILIKVYCATYRYASLFYSPTNGNLMSLIIVRDFTLI